MVESFNNKKVALVIVLLLCLTASGCHFFWVKYQSKKHKFSILLPRWWEREEGYQNTVVIAKAPMRRKDDKFQENVNVVVSEMPPQVTIEMFFEMSKEATLKIVPGVKMDVTDGEMFAGTYRGKWFAFTTKSGQYILRAKSCIWMKNNRAYVVTCTADLDDWEANQLYFNKIMRSLRMR